MLILLVQLRPLFCSIALQFGSLQQKVPVRPKEVLSSYLMNLRMFFLKNMGLYICVFRSKIVLQTNSEIVANILAGLGAAMIVLLYHCIVTYSTGGRIDGDREGAENIQFVAGQSSMRPDDAVVAAGHDMPLPPAQAMAK